MTILDAVLDSDEMSVAGQTRPTRREPARGSRPFCAAGSGNTANHSSCSCLRKPRHVVIQWQVNGPLSVDNLRYRLIFGLHHRCCGGNLNRSVAPASHQGCSKVYQKQVLFINGNK
jgi:hypothetical protein